MRMSRALPRSTRSVPPSGRGKSRPASDTPPVSLQFRQRVRTDAGCPHNRCTTEAIRVITPPSSSSRTPLVRSPGRPRRRRWRSPSETCGTSYAATAPTDAGHRGITAASPGRLARRHYTAFVAIRHRVAARPVLPVLFRFVPGLGPELVLFGPHSLHVHRPRHLPRLRGRPSRFDGRSHPSPRSGSGDAAGAGPSSRQRPRAPRAPRTDIRSPLLKGS